jgi:PQQ-dependent catabolism-associated CXXCW motif protein
MNAGAKRRIDRRRVLTRAFAVVAFASGPYVSGPSASAQVLAPLFDAQGYRCARYRASVDRMPDPAPRIPLDRALALQGRALFIDVLPAEGALRDPASGRWTLAEPHQTIPGALWYPETGRAPVDPVLWRALRRRIDARGDRPVIVFCRADCWMSWNAARRLAREGVQGVTWLAEGIDGWHDAGRALESAQPEPTAG